MLGFTCMHAHHASSRAKQWRRLPGWHCMYAHMRNLCCQVATTAIKQFLRLAVSFRQDAKLHLLRNERGHSIHWAIGLKQIQAAA